MSTYRRLSRTSRSNQPTNQYMSQNTERDGTTLEAQYNTQKPKNYNPILFTIGSEDHNNAYPAPPKHISFPDVPNSSDLANEFFVFAYTLLAAAMQFLHLYRTVWWLPESYTNTAMNFYLIDPHLAAFITTLLGRRFVYCILIKALDSLCPQSYKALNVTRFVYSNLILLVLCVCCVNIFQKQSYVVIFLCYPIVVYILTFGLEMEPFLRTTFTSDTPYLNGAPLHCCSTNPVTVRSEIDALKVDYNNRCKQVLFTAVLNAYYAAFIPCCFAQSFVFYDIYWATQHLAFLVLGGITMCTMFCFPANYCDVLHRASLHLGQWVRVENRSHAPPATVWSKMVVWPPGSYVKHGGETFKATGQVTTAIPANGVHYRFYLFFQNPAHLYFIVSIIQSLLLIAQLMVLFFAIEWHNTLSLAFLLLANYHTLFKSARDYLVTNKIYSAESSVNDGTKIGTPSPLNTSN